MSVAVVDSKPSDYREGRACAAHANASLIATLGAKPGDVLRVTTQRGRTALVRLMPAELDSGNRTSEAESTIRFDRFTRQALKAFPHERVTVQRADIGSAPQVVLVPKIDLPKSNYARLVPYLKEALVEQQAPLMAGMLLYVRLPNAPAGMSYDVHYVEGEEGVVTAQTALYLEDGSHEHDEDHQHEHQSKTEVVVDTTYEDIGGLGAQIRVVREFVELPLVFPQVYQQLGIEAPRGVIFYGAPGTGKTLLARSVANEVNARFVYINGPDVVGTYTGQTEENLRKIFTEASLNPPSIIFFDELDAVAPKRDAASTLADTRAVTQLLALMDGLKRAEGVIVIGTTNRLEAIDPALRRPGRFDREVYFPTPTVEARQEILRVHTREVPMDDDALQALPEIAAKTYGFVGADIMELTREAGLSALRRASQGFLENPSINSYPSSEDLVVRLEDFKKALERVHPSSLRESLMSYPDVTWSDIGGLEDIKKRLRDLVERPLKRPELFTSLGLPTNLGLLLYGPPGTGKTLLAKALARESGVNFIAVQGSELLSQWLGESEEAVRRVFDTARRAAPCIIFFDQLDAIAAKRMEVSHEGSRAPQRVLNQLLSELDGMEQLSQVAVLGATNDVSLIDPAILRPGRFGVHLEVRLPDEAERAAILRVHLRGARFSNDLNVDDLVARVAARTEGFSGAQLAFLCQAAKLEALDESGQAEQAVLADRHFQAALANSGFAQ